MEKVKKWNVINNLGNLIFILFFGKNLGDFSMFQIYETNETKNPINSHTFSCDICSYITNNKKDYNKHLMRQKHQHETNMKHLKHENPQKSSNDKNLYVYVDYTLFSTNIIILLKPLN